MHKFEISILALAGGTWVRATKFRNEYNKTYGGGIIATNYKVIKRNKVARQKKWKMFL